MRKNEVTQEKVKEEGPEPRPGDHQQEEAPSKR